MNSWNTGKALSRIAGVVVLIVAGWLWLRLRPRPAPAPAPAQMAETARPATRAAGAIVRRPAPPPAINPPPPADNPAKRSYLEVPVPTLPIEEIERYLERNGRSAASLLAVCQVSGDEAYLREAASNHPDDPRVQFAVLAKDLFPEQRQAWLERFKQSDPANPLPRYLAALEDFKNGNAGAALQELAVASQQSAYNDHTLEMIQDVEELHLGAGTPAVQAKIAALNTPLPHLVQLKRLGQEMMTLRDQYTAAGDTASADAMGQMVLGLADRLTQGDGGRFLINQLVGVAIERRLLDQLPPSADSDLLGMTAGQRIAELTDWKNSLKEATSTLEARLKQASEAELISYFDRLKTSGELEAVRWLESKREQP